MSSKEYKTIIALLIILGGFLSIQNWELSQRVDRLEAQTSVTTTIATDDDNTAQATVEVQATQAAPQVMIQAAPTPPAMPQVHIEYQTMSTPVQDESK